MSRICQIYVTLLRVSLHNTTKYVIMCVLLTLIHGISTLPGVTSYDNNLILAMFPITSVQAFRKIIFLFLNQNIWCGYSKESSQWEGSFEHPKQMLKFMGEKLFTIFYADFFFVYLNLWVQLASDEFYIQTRNAVANLQSKLHKCNGVFYCNRDLNKSKNHNDLNQDINTIVHFWAKQVHV